MGREEAYLQGVYFTQNNPAIKSYTSTLPLAKQDKKYSEQSQSKEFLK